MDRRAFIGILAALTGCTQVDVDAAEAGVAGGGGDDDGGGSGVSQVQTHDYSERPTMSPMVRDSLETELLPAVNRRRTGNGARSVDTNRALGDLARYHATELGVNGGTARLTSEELREAFTPSLSVWVLAYGIPYEQGDSRDILASDVAEAWLDDPGTRDLLLTEARVGGTGAYITDSAKGTTAWLAVGLGL